jgi:uncharacterized protein (TIGR02452 family)
MANHTSETIRAPRRLQAATIKALSGVLMDTGVLAPAQVHPAASVDRLNASDRAVDFRILPTHSHAAAFEAPGLTGVLIFGSSRRPGGGWENGAKAQEEDVSLVSTWAVQAAASQGFYQENHLAGQDLVLMARGGWLMDPQGANLDPPRPVMFAGIAAPNRADPKIAALPAAYQQERLACRLLGALDAWERQSVDTLVLGAIGCGVFRWPAEESAKALRMALNASTWKGDLILAMPDPVLAKVFSQVLSAPKASPSPRRAP